MTESRSRTLRCCGIALASMLLLFSWGFLFPQSKNVKKEEASKSQADFRVSVNVVVLNATVTDRKGNLVKDLTVEDFRVYDDGKLQPIQTFAMELSGATEPEEAESAAAKPDSAVRKKGETRSQMRSRMISIVIDDLTMETPLDFVGIIDAVKKFVNNDMNPGDQVAILSGSRRVQLPFSDHKQQLLEELPLVLEKLNVETTIRPCGPDLTDLEAYEVARKHGRGVSAYNIQLADLCEKARISLPVAGMRQNGDSEFRTHSLLQTMRQHVRALRHFKGAKTVVLFSDGIVAQKGTATAYKLQEVIDLALRSGIVLNVVGTRGVDVYMDYMFKAPVPDDDKPEEVVGRTIGAGSKALLRDNTWKMLVRLNDKWSQERPLIQMAFDTGGMFHGGNFMDKSFHAIVRREIFCYILTYAQPQTKADGEYHSIGLEVTRPGMDLSYRKGYYTPKEELSFETRRKEDIIAALAAPGNMNEIPMTLSYNFFQEDDLSYSISFITDVKIRGLQFYEEDSRRKNLISLTLAAYDESDHYLSGVEKSIDFRLLEESYAGLREHGLKSSVELKLPMGRYKIKAVVRENNQNKMGSVAKSVEIP